jgi:hypothetical protein
MTTRSCKDNWCGLYNDVIAVCSYSNVCYPEKEKAMQHFKARIAPKNSMMPADGRIHAIDMWFDASNIISAAATVEQFARTLGFGPDDITSITERTRDANM